MNKQQVAAQKRVERITTRLEKRLGISEWVRVDHFFICSPEDSEDETSQASTKPVWEHRYASIKWRLHELATASDDEIEMSAIHEYVHILIDPLASQIPKGKLRGKLEELAVESVARCLKHALE